MSQRLQVMYEEKPCYDIVITGNFEELAEEMKPFVNPEKKVCIVTDTIVKGLYGEAVKECLKEYCAQVDIYAFAPGEENKNPEQYIRLLQHLASHALGRSDCILALGGGVVGDLAGFAAATYLRGIPYIQAPTTLLAMVDASVGGKTAIDLPEGKNLCGAFYQPAAVVCDIDTLITLPQRIFLDGCAEVIKYAILFDPDLFSQLEDAGPGFHPESVIARCITLKRDIVAADELENDVRTLLNLGHTLGHAIEKCSQYSIPPGQAVAIGTAMVCRSSHCPDTARILALLERFHLPATTQISPEQLLEAALADKKRYGSAIRMIIPQRIGHCSMHTIPITELLAFIKEGL